MTAGSSDLQGPRERGSPSPNPQPSLCTPAPARGAVPGGIPNTFLPLPFFQAGSKSPWLSLHFFQGCLGLAVLMGLLPHLLTGWSLSSPRGDLLKAKADPFPLHCPVPCLTGSVPTCSHLRSRGLPWFPDPTSTCPASSHTEHAPASAPAVPAAWIPIPGYPDGCSSASPFNVQVQRSW